MQAQYGDGCLLGSKIYGWVDRFKQGGTSANDKERWGQLSTSVAESSVKAKDLVMENKRIPVGEIANALNVSHGSVYSILHDRLNF
jgi:transposase